MWKSPGTYARTCHGFPRVRLPFLTQNRARLPKDLLTTDFRVNLKKNLRKKLWRHITCRVALISGTHSKYSIKTPKALPYNVAWPFFSFLSWCSRQVSAAMICGRKRPLTLNLASMLRKMVLPDNVGSCPLLVIYHSEISWHSACSYWIYLRTHP